MKNSKMLLAKYTITLSALVVPPRAAEQAVTTAASTVASEQTRPRSNPWASERSVQAITTSTIAMRKSCSTLLPSTVLASALTVTMEERMNVVMRASANAKAAKRQNAEGSAPLFAGYWRTSSSKSDSRDGLMHESQAAITGSSVNARIWASEGPWAMGAHAGVSSTTK